MSGCTRFVKSQYNLKCHIFKNKYKQAISAHERSLCQLTVCFEFQIRS